MSKQNTIEATGVILREEGSGFFRVELDQPKGHTCLCRASGKIVTRKINLLEGDEVTVELSTYDLSRGRITLRNKKK